MRGATPRCEEQQLCFPRNRPWQNISHQHQPTNQGARAGPRQAVLTGGRETLSRFAGRQLLSTHAGACRRGLGRHTEHVGARSGGLRCGRTCRRRDERAAGALSRARGGPAQLEAASATRAHRRARALRRRRERHRSPNPPSLCQFPLDTIKLRQQLRGTAHRSARRVVRDIVREGGGGVRGLLGLYRGVGPGVLGSVLSSGALHAPLSRPTRDGSSGATRGFGLTPERPPSPTRRAVLQRVRGRKRRAAGSTASRRPRRVRSTDLHSSRRPQACWPLPL